MKRGKRFAAGHGEIASHAKTNARAWRRRTRHKARIKSVNGAKAPAYGGRLLLAPFGLMLGGAIRHPSMSPASTLLLSSLALFEVKHFLCDFVLQTTYLYRNKGIYGHLAGVLHAGLHVLGSLPAIFLIGGTPGLIAVIVIGEFLVHYHVDWLKLHIDHRYRLRIDRSAYWIVFGLDQLLHQATYIAILLVLAQAAHL